MQQSAKPASMNARGRIAQSRAPGSRKRVAATRHALSKPQSPQLRAAAAAEKDAVEETTIDQSINTVRFLAIDAVENASSGHPGLPMGCAGLGYLLFREFMKHNPKNPNWFNRDRFVLSAGHGCMLQYALMHLTGYDDITMEEMKTFRQPDSKCPGHPENFHTKGVEVTTGPLGQGISMAVGLALAEKHLAARFNRPGCNVVDHHVYCIAGDGDMMEGVQQEAISFAGHQGLGKLICFYDDNNISIDGEVGLALSEDVLKRYEACGWHVQHVPDATTDLPSLRKAIERAQQVTDKPSMIKVTTLIGYGSPNKVGTESVHGAALGTDEVEATRNALKWKHTPFEVPDAVYDHMGEAQAIGASKEGEWNELFKQYEKSYPDEAKQFSELISKELPKGWEGSLPSYTPDDKPQATRHLSQECLNALGSALPGFIGGSADLAPSNMTLMKQFGDMQKDTPHERNLRFGVREHGMSAISNGIQLHQSGLIPYAATFTNFCDYMRAGMRLSALQGAGVIYVTSHDSIGLGEDGPTHQPVETFMGIRAMPNMLFLRPADGNETAGAYSVAVQRRHMPSTMALSRQKVNHLPNTSQEGVQKGAYSIYDTDKGSTPDVIAIGTGSETEIALNAAKEVEESGKKVRVVSFPSWELFEEQSDEYKQSILPKNVPKASIEAGSTFNWAKYAHKSIGVDDFGRSGPGGKLYPRFGLTKENMVHLLQSF